MPVRPDRDIAAVENGILRTRESAGAPAFYSISDAAAMLGVSPATLYRAVAEGQFPAVRIRDRVIVPAKAIEELTNDAINGCAATVAGPFGDAR